MNDIKSDKEVKQYLDEDRYLNLELRLQKLEEQLQVVIDEIKGERNRRIAEEYGHRTSNTARQTNITI